MAKKTARASVYEVLRPIALAGKHATVKMSDAAITAVLEWARIAEFRAEGSPVETVRRRLPKRAGGPKHYDALHFSEVWGALALIDATNCAPATKRAIRFTALTASRQVEVRRATWEQFDLEGATRVEPAEATKTANSHRVPLSSQALDVLAEARKGNRGALVFPGTRPGAMIGNVVMTQALRNAGVAASGHGFRSRLPRLCGRATHTPGKDSVVPCWPVAPPSWTCHNAQRSVALGIETRGGQVRPTARPNPYNPSHPILVASDGTLQLRGSTSIHGAKHVATKERIPSQRRSRPRPRYSLYPQKIFPHLPENGQRLVKPACREVTLPAWNFRGAQPLRFGAGTPALP